MLPHIFQTIRWIPALVLFALTACSEQPVAPLVPAAQFRVIARPESSDTIGAILQDSLVLEVLNATGKPESGALVHVTGRVGATPSMLVWNEVVQGWSEDRTYFTDTRGRVSIAVRMGDYTGGAALTVTAARDPVVVADTVRFTITPGNLHAVVAATGDTALVLNRGFTLSAKALDRRGNVRSDPILYLAANAKLIVSASGSVSTLSYGRSYVVSSTGSLSDTTWVSSVPAGRLVSVWGNWLDLFETDGSNPRRIIVPYRDLAYPVWLPSGEIIVTGQQNFQAPRLLAVDTVTMGTRRIIPDTSAIVSEQIAAVSRDGSSIYFIANSISTARRYQLWRVRIDGTGLERIWDNTFEYYDGAPAASPDQSRVIFHSGLTFEGSLYQLDMNTREATLFRAAAWNPKWSPTADRLAFFAYDGLWIMGPDGVNLRRLLTVLPSSVMRYHWSPDGQWIAFYNQNISLINIESGERIPLPFATNSRSDGIAWR